MKVVDLIAGERPPGEALHAVVSAGAFDGVHLGHRAVLSETRRLAAERGACSVAVVHPGEPPLLTTVAHRLELLSEIGVDLSVVASEGFDLDRLSPIAVATVAPVTLPGSCEPISSTAIRRALVGGDVALAAAMLGRSHETRGIVKEGDHRGRTIGFPTANLYVPTEILLPADGVYGGWYDGKRAGGPAGTRHLAAINVGRRPTFYEDGIRLVEAFLIDFDGDLYGDEARVLFGVRLRDELKFESVDDLVHQMHRDVEQVRGQMEA